MKYKGLTITKAPRFSRMYDKQTGKHKVRISVEIDNESTSVEASGNTESAAYSSAMERFTSTVYGKYSQFEHKFDVSQRLLRGVPEEADPQTLSVESATKSNKLDSLIPDPIKSSAADTDDPEPKSMSLGTPASAQSDPPKRSMIKGLPRNHIDFPGGNDGKSGRTLEEPLPGHILRPGEIVLTAKTLNKSATNNNASIFFGRERTNDPGFSYSVNSNKRNIESRYSDHMGAGCLDLVVGRMAPFPINKDSHSGSINAGPMFNTHNTPEIKNVQLKGGYHPGICMDAARIYMGQMTTLDYNFNIKSPDAATQQQEKKTKLYPCSGIMLKADKLRLHSRQDIKIITGGRHEKFNSQGNRITQNNGIHLISENGSDKSGKRLPQQPLVLGDNLVEGLTKMVDLISKLGGIVDAFTASQMNFNQILANHYHILPELLPTPPSIEATLQGILTTLDLLINTRLGLFMNDLNKGLYATKYLDPGGPKYINSRNNTVN